MNKLKNNNRFSSIFNIFLAFAETVSVAYLMGASIKLLPIFVFLAAAFYIIEKKINLGFSLKLNLLVFSAVFAGCLFFGRAAFSDSVALKLYSPVLYIFFIKLMYNLCCLLSGGFEKFNSDLSPKKEGGVKFFLICWALIFIAWVPYLLTSLPGILTYDSIKQINMALGNIPLTDHHPVLHTMIIKVCLKVGNGSPIVYSVFQMLCLSAAFSFTLAYIRSKGVKHKFTLPLIFAWYALNPLHAVYSINMQKDTLFGAAVLLLTVALYEMVITRGECLKKAKWLIFFIVSVLLVCFLRNNGPIVLIILLPILFFVFKKERKQIIAVFLIFVLSMFLVKTAVFNALDIEKGSFAESVGVPLQQIARVVYDGNKLTAEEQETLEKFIPVSYIKDHYYPGCVDPLKSKLYGSPLDHEALNNNKGEFFSLWFKLLLKYPKTYVAAYLDETAGYWYPFEVSYISTYNYIPENDLNISADTVSANASAIIEKVIKICFNRRIPGVSLIFSMGAMIFAVLFLALNSIGKKSYIKLVPFLPALLLWFSVLISAPISNHLRYLYPAFTVIPLLITFSLKNVQKQK